ncbi:GTPase domain-containing protein [Pengzhenrongella sicca]|uniref:GTPase domain-containing protein n=1 Tax=Pengzhenrongella sicca TaxID=2819238 RepID=A0A8A4ZLJ3_9MICO|nr:GTPase domain-containing protein [Pengzhenrongella sicca]QTE30438.1 GTPase domain-containing protein [Pengzhenrongella sicca]
MTRAHEPEPARPDAELLAALVSLRGAVAEVRLALEQADVARARADRVLMLDQLDDYLLPRVRAVGAPLLVVIGGSTGAGKSTLVNSLLGAVVSDAGVLRPTTRAPVLVHHPLDAGWFRGDRVLPGLARITTPGAGAAAAGAGVTASAASVATPAAPGDSPGRELRLVGSVAVPPGLALLDAPDIDSVVEENRRLATQLLGAADLWLFVTTAARYADAVPWDLLETAARRRTEVAIVLDRVDHGAGEAIGTHLRQMLVEHGLAAAPVLMIGETPLEDGLLPADVVAPVADWLTALGVDAGARAAAIARTRDGATADVLVRAAGLADAADLQRDADARLRTMVTTPYGDALDAVLRATSDGTMLRGEVLARWQDVVGTGEMLRGIQTRVSRARDRLVAAVQGKPAAAPELANAIGHGLEAVVLDAAEDAADRAHAAWRADPAGAALLAGIGLARSSAELRSQVAAEIRGWQSDVLELVSEEGASKRATARALSFGVNGLGAALMVMIFAATGGLTGAEVGVAGGSALLAQRVLEAVFGDDAVRQLARAASVRLAERVRGVLDGQAARFLVELDTLGTAQASGAALRLAAGQLAGALRRAEQEQAGATARPAGGTPGSAAGSGLRGAGLRRAGATGARADRDRTGTDRTGADRTGADRTDAVHGGGLRGWWRRRRSGPGQR